MLLISYTFDSLIKKFIKVLDLSDVFFKDFYFQVLLRLLNQNVLVELEKRELEKFPEKQFIYKKGVPSDYFVLILEV